MSGGLYKWTKTHGSIKQQVQTKLEAYWVLIDSEWRKRPRYTTRYYMTWLTALILLLAAYLWCPVTLCWWVKDKSCQQICASFGLGRVGSRTDTPLGPLRAGLRLRVTATRTGSTRRTWRTKRCGSTVRATWLAWCWPQARLLSRIRSIIITTLSRYVLSWCDNCPYWRNISLLVCCGSGSQNVYKISKRHQYIYSRHVCTD